jgi:hypothetical protein
MTVVSSKLFWCLYPPHSKLWEQEFSRHSFNTCVYKSRCYSRDVTVHCTVQGAVMSKQDFLPVQDFNLCYWDEMCIAVLCLPLLTFSWYISHLNRLSIVHFVRLLCLHFTRVSRLLGDLFSYAAQRSLLRDVCHCKAKLFRRLGSSTAHAREVSSSSSSWVSCCFCRWGSPFTGCRQGPSSKPSDYNDANSSWLAGFYLTSMYEAFRQRMTVQHHLYEDKDLNTLSRYLSTFRLL